jgi:hypothetical protein
MPICYVKWLLLDVAICISIISNENKVWHFSLFWHLSFLFWGLPVQFSYPLSLLEGLSFLSLSYVSAINLMSVTFISDIFPVYLLFMCSVFWSFKYFWTCLPGFPTRTSASGIMRRNTKWYKIIIASTFIKRGKYFTLFCTLEKACFSRTLVCFFLSYGHCVSCNFFSLFPLRTSK